ncbi:MAG: hypothetical protein ACR2HR_10620 [Euzebya sp.]
MPTTELTADAINLLRVMAELDRRHQVMTVQAGAIGAGMSYLDAFDLVNRLFGQGLLSHDLSLTDAGRKAIG